MDNRPNNKSYEVLYLYKIPLDETVGEATQSASALTPPEIECTHTALAEGAVGGDDPGLLGPTRTVRAVRDASRSRPPGYVGSSTVAEVRACPLYTYPSPRGA